MAQLSQEAVNANSLIVFAVPHADFAEAVGVAVLRGSEATLPALITLYLLKRKRVRLTVPSSILWQRFLAETQANRPFQKLRNNLLMLLQLLLLLALTFALARPFPWWWWQPQC